MNTHLRAYISLGSNKGQSRVFLGAARETLKVTEGLTLIASSPIYSTEPQGYKDQDWFYNQTIALDCTPSWTGLKLLQFMQGIENELGRERSPDTALRYGPRNIDLDLLLFGHEVQTDPVCILPHPRMWQRAFVLIPLRDVLQQDILAHEADAQKLLHEVSTNLALLDYSVEDMKIYQKDIE